MRLGVTPVLIPNTMVKAQTADGTILETVWESRWLPEKISPYVTGLQIALSCKIISPKRCYGDQVTYGLIYKIIFCRDYKLMNWRVHQWLDISKIIYLYVMTDECQSIIHLRMKLCLQQSPQAHWQLHIENENRIRSKDCILWRLKVWL